MGFLDELRRDLHLLVDRTRVEVFGSADWTGPTPARPLPPASAPRPAVSLIATVKNEGAQAGTLKVVGADRDVIVREAARLLTDPAEYARMAAAPNPYGDGQASRRIADVLAGLNVRG